MNRKTAARRRGGLMVCVIASMAVVMSLVGLIVRDASAARRAAKQRLQLEQTERLLDAGILRAAKQHRRDEAFAGELWQPEILFAGRPAKTSVRIRIDDGRAEVTAKLGDAPFITTRSHSFALSPDS